MTAPVVILGLGAQAKYAAETFRLLDRAVAGLYDAGPAPGAAPGPRPAEFAGMPVRGDLAALLADYDALGAPEILVCCPDNARKQALVRALAEALVPRRPAFALAVHPRAVVATSAAVAGGAIVNACAVVQPFARVGAHAMIHAGAILEHDVVVEAFANIAPGAVLAGHVRVGRGATVFAGATVIPGVRIGAGAMVAAGAVVLRDVPEGGRVAGVPAAPMSGTSAPEDADV
ncbi:MAG: hypothetical protein AB7D57_05325 [Desulfovibrionaceae bacterium]